MKKLFSLALACLLLFSLSACGREPKEEVSDEKPVIYLYPEQETDVRVTLDLAGELTCAYPAYGDGWSVRAAPDGTLTDEDGQTYRYLYWEGTSGTDYDFSTGFCVAGEDTAAFLEDALAQLGHHEVDDLHDLVLGQALEHDDLVDTVQELRAESLAQLRHHGLLGLSVCSSVLPLMLLR